jgi:hypothetical protein
MGVGILLAPGFSQVITVKRKPETVSTVSVLEPFQIVFLDQHLKLLFEGFLSMVLFLIGYICGNICGNQIGM